MTADMIEEIASKPHWVSATLDRIAEGFAILTVTRSVHCRNTDSWMEKVNHLRETYCRVNDGGTRIIDGDLMGGQGTVETDELFAECPPIPHTCTFDVAQLETRELRVVSRAG